MTTFEATEIRFYHFQYVSSIFFFNDFFYLLSNISITIKNHINLYLSTLLGADFCILFQQTVFKSLTIGIGWSLLILSPFVSLFSKREKERINKLTVIYSLFSIVGVGIVLI